MNSRNVVRLFMTTLLLGGLVGAVTGIITRWNEFNHYFSSFDIISILSTFVWLFGIGLIFSVISQAGFFAYLTIHRFGLGLFKSVSLWNAVQVLLILFVVGDFIYLRYVNFETGEGLLPYIWPAVFLVIVGIIVAYFKMKQTNKQAFIPALFFMIVATILEWSPILRENDQSWLYFMLFPLLICNGYQLLILNKLIKRSEEERASKRVEANLSKSNRKRSHFEEEPRQLQ